MAANPSVTENILDAAIDALKTIDGSDGFHLNIESRAQRVVSAAPNVVVYPSVECYVAADRPSGQTGLDTANLYNGEMAIEVWGWAQNQEDPQGAASQVAQDIRTAIENQANWYAQTYDINWTGTLFSLPDDKRGVGLAQVGFLVRYWVQREDTSLGI